MGHLVAIDLFCGAGGLSHGLIKSGIEVAVGIDLDASCSFPFVSNNSAIFLNHDIRSVHGNDIKKFYPKNCTKILVGCAPCQPFSRYTNGIEPKETQWSLLLHFSKLIKQLSPDVISMENVPGLLKHKVFDLFVNKLKQLGYLVSHTIVFGPDYGIPQTRSRLVLMASLKSKINLIPRTHAPNDYCTVADTIKHLPKLKAGQADLSDRLHRCSNLSPLNMARIKASRPGGSWYDWPVDLIADCHSKPTGKSYPSVYGRMSWDQPSPTITTLFYGYGNGRFGHPNQDRALSLREGALLQTFPPNYQFVSPEQKVNMKQIGRLIGNAVPVMLGEVIGKSIKAHVEGLNVQ